MAGTPGAIIRSTGVSVITRHLVGAIAFTHQAHIGLRATVTVITGGRIVHRVLAYIGAFVADVRRTGIGIRAVPIGARLARRAHANIIDRAVETIITRLTG